MNAEHKRMNRGLKIALWLGGIFGGLALIGLAITAMLPVLVYGAVIGGVIAKNSETLPPTTETLAHRDSANAAATGFLPDATWTQVSGQNKFEPTCKNNFGHFQTPTVDCVVYEREWETGKPYMDGSFNKIAERFGKVTDLTQKCERYKPDSGLSCRANVLTTGLDGQWAEFNVFLEDDQPGSNLRVMVNSKVVQK